MPKPFPPPSMAATFPPGFGSLRDMERGIAPVSAQTPAGEVAAWECRHFDPQHGWSPWERIEPRHRLETIEGRVNDIREFIKLGNKYQLRALYAEGEPEGYAHEAEDARVIAAENAALAELSRRPLVSADAEMLPVAWQWREFYTEDRMWSRWREISPNDWESVKAWVALAPESRQTRPLYSADTIAALKKDAERLDWLDKHPREATIRVGTDMKACVFYGVSCDPKWTMREAIDAAIDAAQTSKKNG